MPDRVDLSEFDNPWTGLATMIFWQTAHDYILLGDRESMAVSERIISKSEIVAFFDGEWADMLAYGLGWNVEEMKDFVK